MGDPGGAGAEQLPVCNVPVRCPLKANNPMHMENGQVNNPGDAWPGAAGVRQLYPGRLHLLCTLSRCTLVLLVFDIRMSDLDWSHGTRCVGR